MKKSLFLLITLIISTVTATQCTHYQYSYAEDIYDSQNEIKIQIDLPGEVVDRKKIISINPNLSFTYNDLATEIERLYGLSASQIQILLPAISSSPLDLSKGQTKLNGYFSRSAPLVVNIVPTGYWEPSIGPFYSKIEMQKEESSATFAKAPNYQHLIRAFAKHYRIPVRNLIITNRATGEIWAYGTPGASTTRPPIDSHFIVEDKTKLRLDDMEDQIEAASYSKTESGYEGDIEDL